MNVFFIRNQNENRSKTAEHLFKDRFKTNSGGLYNENPVTKEELNWADLIIVMEEAQRSELSKRFPSIYLSKRILSLDIPDIYKKNQDELISQLNSKIESIHEIVS